MKQRSDPLTGTWRDKLLPLDERLKLLAENCYKNGFGYVSISFILESDALIARKLLEMDERQKQILELLKKQ